MQRDGRQRRPLVDVTADELGREVLGLGGAAAVARHQQSLARQQGSGQPPAPVPRGLQPGQRAAERLNELLDVQSQLGSPDLSGSAHEASAVSVRPPARAPLLVASRPAVDSAVRRLPAASDR